MEFQRAQILEMQCPLALHRNGMGKQPNLPMSQEVGKIGEQMNFKGYQGQGKQTQSGKWPCGNVETQLT